MCAKHVGDAVHKTKGVSSVDVNLAGNEMTVTFDEHVAGDSEIISAVKAIGFDAKPMADK